MSHTRLRPAFTFTDEKLAELKRVAPEAFADGKVNWEVLKEALGEHVDDEGAEAEHFGLSWPGKRDARRMAGTPSTGALVPKPGDGVNEDTTRNIFIEGENLEVLKLLHKAYRGKVKMIYIDPPYNTGNDFVYEDDFTEPLEEYLRRTGQVDEEGKALTTNTRADGRFHSKWLSMMYPRLRLARQLLRDDGVIFVSIDDNEVHHLRALMNEVFGEENFIVQFVWKARLSEDTRAKTGASRDHEYVLCFSRGMTTLRGAEKDLEKFDNPDDDPRGPWRSADLTGLATIDKRPNLHYDLIDPKTKINYGCPPKGWRYDRGTMKQRIEEDRILFPKESTGRPRHKVFLNEMRSTFKNISSIITSTSTSAGTKEVDAVMGSGMFSFPKPSAFIKIFLEQALEKDDIVLDFFAGSGTTGHAVQQLNDADGGERKFILVQLPEPLEEGHAGRKLKFKTIADITRERLKRTFAKSKSDMGFVNLALSHSNYRAWKDYHGTDAKALEDLFAAQETPLREGWTVEGLTTEVMLLEGFPLDSRVEVQKAFKKNTVQRIHHEWHQHALFVCLDKKIHAETIAALTLGEGDTFICLDTAIDDQSKLRLSDKGMIKTI